MHGEIIASGLEFPEGPVWLDGAIWFTEIVGGHVSRWTPDAGVERIRDDRFYEGPFFDGYGRTGLLITGVWADDTAVHIEVITSRVDAPDYFSARYGPLVRVQVVGDRFECPPLRQQGSAIGP